MTLKDVRGSPARFLVEMSPDESAVEDIEVLAERCREACRQVSGRGAPVRLVRSVFVPEDHRCLLVYEAGSAEVVAEAVAAAGIASTRVIEAIRLEPGIHLDPGLHEAPPGS